VVAAPHRGKPCHTHRVMTNRSADDRVSPVVGRPPLVVVFVAILVIALGELGGAVLSQLRPATARWAAARVAANPQAPRLPRDAGVELSEAWVLTPLGSSAILGLIGLAVVLASPRGAPEVPAGR